ncbi:MAG TPA: CBS domain-containing protein [Acidobacteriaceae bacterium]
MRGWSFPLGRWFGVDLRIHAFFLILLAFCLFSTSVANVAGWRGIGLWLVLLSAVGAREIARTIAAAYHRISLRSILLLPIGGLLSYADPESGERASTAPGQLSLSIVGPLANLLLAALLAGLIHGASPHVDLLSRPWITPTHLMRSAVWLNLALALLNCFPAYPLDAGRLLQTSFSRRQGAAEAKRAASGIGRIFGVGAMVAGLALLALPLPALSAALSPWLIAGGFFIAIGAQLEDQGVLYQSVVDTVHMRDVMLTDFATMSPSDTLEDALHRSIHSLQDDFPVVRAAKIVGVVSRQSILEALRGEGNAYVQGIMSRAFQVAQPDDSLGTIIRRMRRGRMALVPVAEAGRVVGVVTLQNLMHSMGPLSEQRKLRPTS